MNIEAVTKGPKNHFFGFHDLSPWDESGRYILAMETDFIDRPPKAGDVARICVIDTESDNALEVVAETRAWNFHQGARAQWLPGKRIVYNDYDDNNSKYISIVLDIKTGEKKILPRSLYIVSPKGGVGLGLNFTRLQKYGGYGYRVEVQPPLEVEPLNDAFPKNDGIWSVNLKTGETKLIISTNDIAHLNNSPKENEHHILTHIAFNPSGSRIYFLDKYRLPDGGFMQRPVTASPDGSDAYVLPGHITHYCWKNDTEILGYGKFSPYIMEMRNRGILKNPLLKPLLKVARNMRGILKQKIAGQSYMLLKDKTQNVERVAQGVITEDGHPQFSPDGKWIVTDTYPDKNHEQTLILYNWETKKRTDVAKFKSLPKGFPDGWDVSEMRSDLHPRWNRDGSKACVDSVDGKARQVYIVDVSDIIQSLNPNI